MEKRVSMPVKIGISFFLKQIATCQRLQRLFSLESNRFFSGQRLGLTKTKTNGLLFGFGMLFETLFKIAIRFFIDGFVDSELPAGAPFRDPYFESLHHKSLCTQQKKILELHSNNSVIHRIIHTTVNEASPRACAISNATMQKAAEPIVVDAISFTYPYAPKTGQPKYIEKNDNNKTGDVYTIT